MRLEKSDFNGQSTGGKIKIRVAKMKNFSYACNLLKRNHCIECKITEYEIILLQSIGKVPKNGGIGIIREHKAILVFSNTNMPRLLFQA